MFEDDDILLLEDDRDEETIEENEPKSELDDEVLKSMMRTGENTEGTFIPDEGELLDEEEEAHEEIDEDAEMTVGQVREQLGKYSDELLFDMQKNPDKYMVQTERGEMSLMEAIQQGWNPATKSFDAETPRDEFRESLGDLSPEDQQALMNLTDPATAHIPPDEAAMYGVDPNSPMVDGVGQDPRIQGAPQDPSMMDPNMGGMGGMF